MRQSAKTALAGIVSALAVAIMFATTLIPFLTYALPAISGALLILIVIEVNRKWAFASYAAVSILSFLLLNDKEAALMYIAFFGYYPVIKSMLESRLPRVVEYLVKLLLFNVSVISATLLAVFVLKIPLEDVEERGPAVIPYLLLMANAMFLLYDYTLTQFVQLYLKKIQHRFRKLFR
ncbi:MAG: hypothetical protein LBS36_08745 [Oscillospiraceae bacterium]|jgi:hypothetical protein|nr:hypothetical protein [Oscillospiraceae bacterium]